MVTADKIITFQPYQGSFLIILNFPSFTPKPINIKDD